MTLILGCYFFRFYSIYFWYTDNNLISKALSAHPIPFRSSSLVLPKHDPQVTFDPAMSIKRSLQKHFWWNQFSLDEQNESFLDLSDSLILKIFSSSVSVMETPSCKLLNSQTINDIYSSMTDNWFSMVSEGELCCNLLKIAPFCFFTIQVQKGFFLFSFNESVYFLLWKVYCTVP